LFKVSLALRASFFRKSHAWEMVAAALERHVDDAAACASVLGVVRVRLNLEFLDRVDGRAEVVDAAGAVGDAIEQELVRLDAAAVDRPVRAALVVERPQPRGAC